MGIEFCIRSDSIRAALQELEAAEKNGFTHCLAVFRLTNAGPMLDECRAEYSDLLERAADDDPNLNWGRFQGVTRKYKFKNGQLVGIANG